MLNAAEEHKQFWSKYLAERRATYEFRARTRYAGVFAALSGLGLKDGHTIDDFGAGDCQFGRYVLGGHWRGTYRPYDASISGMDLEKWEALGATRVSFAIAIEVVEHLIDPLRFIRELQKHAIRGVVITTPNCRVVDVIGCDPTHKSIVTKEQLEAMGFAVHTESWFSEQHQPGQADTLVGVYQRV